MSSPINTTLPIIANNDNRKVIIKVGNIELRTVVNVKCSYSLLGLTTREFSVTCEGYTEEYMQVRDLVKQKDTILAYIYLIDTDKTPRNVIYFLRGYIPWSNFITEGNVGNFTWQFSGYDIFGSLHASEISKSAFVNPPINLKNVIGGVLEELNYVSTFDYRETIIDNVTSFQLVLNNNGTVRRVPANIKIGATKGIDLVNIDSGIKSNELIYGVDSNFPRPYNMLHMKADEFLSTVLQLKNLYLLSNGVDMLNVVKPGANSTILENTLILDYETKYNNIQAYSKGNLQSGNYMRGLPSYSTVCAGMNSINNSTNSTNSSDIYTSGFAVDPYAIPHLQTLEIINNIPTNNQDLTNLAVVIANTKRAIKSGSYLYTLKGSFFNNGILYAPNQLIKITDVIHDYDDLMLVEQVVFEYSKDNGCTTVLTVVPQNSFTYLAPEKLLKKITEKKTVKKYKSKMQAVN